MLAQPLRNSIKHFTQITTYNQLLLNAFFFVIIVNCAQPMRMLYWGYWSVLAYRKKKRSIFIDMINPDIPNRVIFFFFNYECVIYVAVDHAIDDASTAYILFRTNHRYSRCRQVSIEWFWPHDQCQNQNFSFYPAIVTFEKKLYVVWESKMENLCILIDLPYG